MPRHKKCSDSSSSSSDSCSKTTLGTSFSDCCKGSDISVSSSSSSSSYNCKGVKCGPCEGDCNGCGGCGKDKYCFTSSSSSESASSFSSDSTCSPKFLSSSDSSSSYDCHKKSKSGHKHHDKKKEFIVTFGPLLQGADEDGPGNRAVIFINNKNNKPVPRPDIKLVRGTTYIFDVKQDPMPNGQYRYDFLLTRSMCGGPQGFAPRPLPGSFMPISHGKAEFKCTDSTPMVFTYQSTKAPAMGRFCVAVKHGC